MLDREKLSSHLHHEDEKMLAGHIFDKVEIVLKRKSTESTNFVNPHQRQIAAGILKQLVDVNYKFEGGYKEAERKRIIIFPEYLFPDHVESTVNLLKIEGNFKFQSVSHRDFLGSILGLGIKREMVGDILVLDEFAEIAVAEEISDFVILKLKKVHQIPVDITEMNPGDIIIPPDNTKEIKSTVASMRLDAVASSGFGDSRNKISRDIKNEKVKVNWKVETDPAAGVEQGDLISIRNRGRVKVAERLGFSHRGRIKLKLLRYT